MPKAYLIAILKIVISAGLMWFALKGVDIETAANKARQVEPLMLASSIFLLLFQSFLGGARWSSVTKVIDCSLELTKAIRLFYIGAFFNQVLPGGVGGDAVRIYSSFKGGLSIRGAINSVMLERLIMVFSLVILVTVIQVTLPREFYMGQTVWLQRLFIILFFLMLFGLWLLMLVDRLPREILKWRLVKGLIYLGSDVKKVFLSLKNIWLPLFLGFSAHLNLALCVYCLAVGLSLNIDFLECVILMPPVFLIAIIPLSIGGWGIRENAMIVALSLIDVPNDSALALSVLFGLASLISSFPGGLVWLLSRERDAASRSKKVQSELNIWGSK